MKTDSPIASILIVDDDPHTRLMLSIALQPEPYLLDLVGSGAEAVERVRCGAYSAALLDIRLPDLDGLTVLTQFHELDPKLPVILLSGQTTVETLIEALNLSAFAYVSKPYDLEEIKGTVRRAVAARALAAKAEQMEAALRDSEERFRSVVESTPDAIVLADYRGTIISLNKSAQRLFGYAEEEILGKPLTVLMPARYRDAHQKGIERSRTATCPRLIGKTIELRGLRKDGSEFPLELSLATWKTPSGTFYSGIIRDITERKQAEQELERLSRRHELTLDSAGEGIYGLDLQGNTTFVNQAAARMLGWEAPALIGQPMHEILHHSKPDGTPYPREQCLIYAAFKDGQTYAVDQEVFWRKDGTSFPVEYVTTPIHERGVLVGAVVVFKDITERKQAEEALRQSEERFRQVTENIKEVFWMTKPDKNEMLYVSPAYEQIWGRTCNSLYASPRSWLDAVCPTDRLRVLEATLTKQVIGEYDEEYRIVRPDGTLRWIQDRAFPIHDASGTVYRIAGIAADITERKQAQEALRNAYNKIETILASLPGAILIVDEGRQVVYANALACQYLEAGDAPVVGRSLCDVLPLTVFEWDQRVKDVRTMDAADASQPQEGEFEAHKRVYRYRLFPVAIRGSELQQIGLVIWDVTEQKQIQDQLIQTEKLASLGTLVSGIAHEINNPVQGILGMAEIIQEEDDPVKIKEYARDIAAYPEHVATVVRDFACYARASARDEAVAIDLGERMTEAVKMVRRCPQFGHVAVVTAFQPVPTIQARRTEIDQVFVNLISNAVQAMEGSGHLTLATRGEGKMAVASVTDTGCGISKSLLSKIFDPFFTTKNPGKGTGLGLSVVYKIVTKYGGTIGVDSTEGHGITFTVRFPLETRRNGQRTEVEYGTDQTACAGQKEGARAGGGR